MARRQLAPPCNQGRLHSALCRRQSPLPTHTASSAHCVTV
ncbi:hypothetical protein PG984_004300 [Apiospora sp. TS-2023a]